MADIIVTQDPTKPGVNKLNGTPIPLASLSTSGAVANDVVTFQGGVWQPIAQAGVESASNLGAGNGVFASKVGTDFQFKGLIAGTNITMTPTATGITIAAGSTVGDIVIVQDQKASGNAGGTFTAAAWQTRTINTEAADTGGNCTIAANQITLLAGTYRCMIRCPAFSTLGHTSRLFNITDAAVEIVGSAAHSISSGQSDSWIIGRFTIATSKVFEIQHQCNTTRATDGFGVTNGFGVNEVFTVAVFWKE